MLPYFHIAGLEIYTWRAVVAGGIVLCWVLFLVRAKRLGYPLSVIFPWLLLGLPVGTLGGHFLNKVIPALIEKGSSYSYLGLTVIGSILFCLVYGLFYARYVIKTSPWKLMDAVAFTFPLGMLIGRLGCLGAGCCFGRIAPDGVSNSLLSFLTLPALLYVFPSAAWQEYHEVAAGADLWNLPLILMINASGVLWVTEYLYQKREAWRLQPGTVFAATVTLYAAGRFGAEFARKERLVLDSVLNPWQLSILVLGVVAFCGLLFLLGRRRTKLKTGGLYPIEKSPG